VALSPGTGAATLRRVTVSFEARTRRRIAAALLWAGLIFVHAVCWPHWPPSPADDGPWLRGLVAVAVWAAIATLIVIVDRVLPIARESATRRLVAHLPLSVGFTYAHVWLFQLIARATGVRTAVDPVTLRPFPLEPEWSVWLLYWVFVGGYLAVGFREQLELRTARATELERLLAQSRIETLRTQLNPHFLFNALNAISAHVEGAPRTARWMLEQLGDLLRLSLDHADEQEIPLQQELAFIDRYLKLQKIRFDNRLDVIVDVEPPALRALVPTFILQPLLENSIRHGIARRSTAGLIEIQAYQENDALHLSVRDDGPGLPSNWDPERGLGVGLRNTRERLRRLYGDDQAFDIATIEGSGVRVDLRLPYRDRSGEGQAN
jgi:two-component system LytT family sensor kinase